MTRKHQKGKYVVLSLVFGVFGFIVAFSYSLASKQPDSSQASDRMFTEERALRSQIVEQQEKNRKLQRELYARQENVRTAEKELSKEEQIFFNLAEDAEKYRMFLGKVKVKGPGVEITLEDGEYDVNEPDVNNYLVHEHHIFKVVNELFIAGASAVAINGQRINHDSYIICTGPVITVDGNQFPAPFKISAIGDSEVLSAATLLAGGVRDQLVNDNIIFTLEKKKQIILEPVLGDTNR